jgi:hypothetical protein
MQQKKPAHGRLRNPQIGLGSDDCDPNRQGAYTSWQAAKDGRVLKNGQNPLVHSCSMCYGDYILYVLVKRIPLHFCLPYVSQCSTMDSCFAVLLTLKFELSIATCSLPIHKVLYISDSLLSLSPCSHHHVARALPSTTSFPDLVVVNLAG